MSERHVFFGACHVTVLFVFYVVSLYFTRYAKRIVQGVALGQSRGLFENLSVNSSYNFLLLWPHTSCSMADRPGELKQNFHANLATELVPHSVQGTSKITFPGSTNLV